jgi:hypothetical protein
VSRPAPGGPARHQSNVERGSSRVTLASPSDACRSTGGSGAPWCELGAAGNDQLTHHPRTSPSVGLDAGGAVAVRPRDWPPATPWSSCARRGSPEPEGAILTHRSILVSALAQAEHLRQTAEGWSAAVVAQDDATVLPPGQVGRVAIEVAGSPLLWFTGYADAPEKTAERYTADGA